MAIRICAINVPAFMHGGLEVGKGWTEIPAKPTDKQRAALRDYHGRFIQVHPSDIDKLGELGLKFVAADAPLAEAPKTKTPAPKDPKNGTPNGGAEKKE